MKLCSVIVFVHFAYSKVFRHTPSCVLTVMAENILIILMVIFPLFFSFLPNVGYSFLFLGSGAPNRSLFLWLIVLLIASKK